MANLSIPDKSPGDLHTSLEFDEQINWMNSPGKSLGAWTPGVTTVDSSGVYDSYTATGNITIAFTGTPKLNNWQKVRITGLNGTYTITIPNDSAIINSSFTDGVAPDAGTYDLWIAYISDEYQFNLASVDIKGGEITAPTMSSATIEDASDDVLDFIFNEAVNITVAGWTIDTDGAGLSISSVLSGTGTSTPKFQLSRSILNTETLTVSYNSGSGNTVSTATSIELESFVDANVINNVGSIQLTAVTLGTAVIGNTEITIPFTNPNSSNEDQNQLYYKLATEPTVWTIGVVAATGATTFPIQTGLTNELEYDFKAVAEGSGSYSDSADSNEISATPLNPVLAWDIPGTLAETDAVSYNDPVGTANDTIGILDVTQSSATLKPLLVLDTEDYIDFDGADDVLENVSLPDSWFTSAFSFMLIVKPTDGQPATIDTFWGGRTTATSNGFWINLETDGKITFAPQIAGVYAPAKTASSVFTNGAQSSETVLIFTISQTNGVRIYVDGVLTTLDGTQSGDLTGKGAVLANYSYGGEYAIGSYVFNGAPISNQYYNGKMRETRLYTGELNQTDINAIIAAL